MGKFAFEICANSVESCIAAQNGGADRVELCAGIPEGGTTPSYGEIKTARRILTDTKLHVIIRPRGGDFLYTGLEIERMIEDIIIAKQLGADGIVCGCLTKEGNIDTETCKKLIKYADGMSMTFHRAFDHCSNPYKALEELIALGFNRVLTSGQQQTADKGTILLGELKRQANGRITILAGCGVNENNIRRIYKETGVTEFHFSARTAIKSRMEHINEKVYMGDKDTCERYVMETSAERVAETIKACIG